MGNARPQRRDNKIIKAARPGLIERVRELNAQCLQDPAVARILGYAPATIAALRKEGGIPAAKKPAKPRQSVPDWDRLHVPCPACNLFIDVKRNRIETHSLLVPLRIVRDGEMQLKPRQCPASGCKYTELRIGIERHKRQTARAA